MKTCCYVKYFEGDKEALASDSVSILDNRNRLAIKIEDARNRAFRLRFVQPRYTHFEIRVGTFQDYWTQYRGAIK